MMRQIYDQDNEEMETASREACKAIGKQSTRYTCA